LVLEETTMSDQNRLSRDLERLMKPASAGWESKHTPGPWTVTVRDHSVTIILGPDRPSSEEIRFRLYGGEDADADAMAIANARLMAAAPDMLAALRESLDLLTSAEAEGWKCRGKAAAVRQIRAAIAKTTQP
jgi:hypothetical protein